MAYWLFKSEPEVWSWAQQKAKGAPGEEWTGVRNYQARNNMRAMKLGARGFFYHSNEGKAVVGIVEDGERIVGAVRTKPQEKELYIQQIAVDPARQGTGVGSWLLQRIDELARVRGLGGLSLETAEMAEANIRLYQRHGFELQHESAWDLHYVRPASDDRDDPAAPAKDDRG